MCLHLCVCACTCVFVPARVCMCERVQCVRCIVCAYVRVVCMCTCVQCVCCIVCAHVCVVLCVCCVCCVVCVLVCGMLFVCMCCCVYMCDLCVSIMLSAAESHCPVCICREVGVQHTHKHCWSVGLPTREQLFASYLWKWDCLVCIAFITSC